jgi:hypothetical protein
MQTPDGFRYTVVCNGALPSTKQPRIERSIESALQADQRTASDRRYGRQVTTKKTRIA